MSEKSEKKIFSIDVAMDEPMFLAVKGIAEADGVSASELIRILISTLIDDRRAYFERLESIFSKSAKQEKPIDAGARPESSAPKS